MRETVQIKTADEIARIRVASLIVHDVLDEVVAAIAPVVTTAALDRVAARGAAARGAAPAFLGYHGYPATICISVNDEVVHGIPSERRVLREGDVVGLDFGVSYQGFFGDAARTVPVGVVAPEAARLLAITAEALKRAIDAARPTAGWATSGSRSRRTWSHGGTRWCVTSSATASGGSCTSRPRCRTTALPAADCGSDRGWCSPSSRW